MKKLVLVVIASFFLVTLAACTNEKKPGTGIIELTYADWGDSDQNQALIDAFMVANPTIRVSLRNDIGGSGEQFTGNLITVAASGLLPDVFATDNVPTVVNAGLARDISSMWDLDPDTELVYENIASTAVYNGKRFAMPSFQFFKGIFLNMDIFERAGLQTVEGKYRMDDYGLPVKDWTYSEWIEIAKAIKNRDFDNPQNFVLGIDGWFGWVDFQQVWPTLDDASVLYDTWDGQQFNYTSPAWIEAMQQKVAISRLNDGTLDDIQPTEITDEDGNVIPGREFLQGWRISTGFTAMSIDGSWQINLINTVKQNSNINMGFWPYPGGSAGNFPPTILDYQVVSSQTDYPEEAYLLAKWMTFGREGWNKRIDLFEARRAEAVAKGELAPILDRYPVAAYPEVWARIAPLVADVDGLSDIVFNIENSKPDLDKWLPGYKDFWAWVYDEGNPYNWFNLLDAGPEAVATYAVQWNNQVNLLVQTELNRLGKD